MWPTDYHMQSHCITEQKNALSLLKARKPSDIEKDEFLIIRAKAAKDWPNDFHMRVHQEKEQFEATRRLKDL